MPRIFDIRIASAGCALALASLVSVPAAAQDVRPLAPPVVEPTASPESDEDDTDGRGEAVTVPIPQTPSRAAAASRASSRVTTVIPTGWASVAVGYQPAWIHVATANGFGPARWNEWFAVSGMVPALSPHPFFGPWGTLAYEGWMFERYRAAWTGRSVRRSGGETALWLQRADRAMIEGRVEDAALAYRRVVQRAPAFAPAYLGLGVALAATGEDGAAARAFRQSFDRYPGWLQLAIDWSDLVSDEQHLDAIQSAVADRARGGAPSSRFVAGVLHLFGGEAAAGQAWLAGLDDDPHARELIARTSR